MGAINKVKYSTFFIIHQDLSRLLYQKLPTACKGIVIIKCTKCKGNFLKIVLVLRST